MSLNGIDISRYQGEPDFSKVKDAVDFVIMRAGYGRYASQIDESFERNYSQCKKYGIPCGAYWFSYAKSANEAKQEASAFLAAVKDKKFEYPIYYDIEGDSLINKSTVSAMCSAFCTELEDAGYFAGIYISRSPAQQYLTDEVRDKYALWIAEYNSQLNWSGPVGMWQYSSTGRINGISGNVDLNTAYTDYPQIITIGGFNGYDKPDDENAKILDSSGFKQGDKSLGVLAYKQMLIIAKKQKIITQSVDDNSSFGEGTLKATNRLLADLGYRQNGIAGNNLIKKLRKLISDKI